MRQSGATAVMATDLDRTLIYSAAAIEAEHHPQDVPRLCCVEWLDGHRQSFLTQGSARALLAARGYAELVPVTTRTLRQYRRVRLPGGPPRFAVTSNGGHIVVDGTPDPLWAAAVRDRIAGNGATLDQIVAELDRRATGAWVRTRTVADDLFCYLVVDLAALPPDVVPEWRVWCQSVGWVVSQQGRKIYTLPLALTKKAAITEIMDRTRADRLVAAGDGALDAGFLMIASAAIRPPHGELAELGWRPDHVQVATARGVLAGTEISHWLAAHVGAGPA